MKLAGIEKLSLVDYPGHLAAVLFTDGCNFRCGYCQNPDLTGANGGGHIGPPLREEDVLDFLASRKEKIEGVVITGGEPAIHKGLPGLIRKIKKMGFLVKLDTNGSRPDVLEELFRFRLLDYVALDIKTSLKKYPFVAGLNATVGANDCSPLRDAVSRSIYLMVLSVVPYEFRTTCVPSIVDEDDFREIGQMVKGAKKYCLQQFRNTITLDPALGDMKPYPPERLYKFRDILKEFVETVEIRGI